MILLQHRKSMTVFRVVDYSIKLQDGLSRLRPSNGVVSVVRSFDDAFSVMFPIFTLVCWVVAVNGADFRKLTRC